MGRLATNQALALEVVARLRGAGVRTFCLCPGGRNAPLVEALTAEASGIEVLDFFEERSAAFFALGRARRDARPAAVVTTSGTACAELLPAMVEAYYSSVPLVAVTADRPRSYRGTAAPQTIEQPGIFGVYARRSFDLEEPGGEWALSVANGPLHVNVCFDEPLLAGWVEEADTPHLSSVARVAHVLTATGETPPAGETPGTSGARATGGTPVLPEGARPLVVLGALQNDGDQEDVLRFCRSLGAPVLAEASSQLTSRLGDLRLRAGEASARRAFEEGICDSVVRIGDIPSFRLWRDLEVKWRVPVVSVSRRRWAGPHARRALRCPRGNRTSNVPSPVRRVFPRALLGAEDVRR